MIRPCRAIALPRLPRPRQPRHPEQHRARRRVPQRLPLPAQANRHYMMRRGTRSTPSSRPTRAAWPGRATQEPTSRVGGPAPPGALPRPAPRFAPKSTPAIVESGPPARRTAAAEAADPPVPSTRQRRRHRGRRWRQACNDPVRPCSRTELPGWYRALSTVCHVSSLIPERSNGTRRGAGRAARGSI